MIQDPWKHFQQNSSEASTTMDKNYENSNPETKDEEEPGGSNST